MITCFDTANYFLFLADSYDDDSISNLKLQKLVYYAQGFHLALHNTPLFGEEIIAWQHGPVVPELYRQYKIHGKNPIPRDENFSANGIPKYYRDLMDEVYEVYGQYSAWKLRNMTHAEPPWIDADCLVQGVVTHVSMQEYFKTLIV